jgi:hypothetical protein
MRLNTLLAVTYENERDPLNIHAASYAISE